MSFNKTTDDLNAILIHQVGEYLGIRLPKKGSTRCPLPAHKDTKPSFSIYDNGTRWNCFGCGEGGGAIDFVMAMRNIDFIRAKKLLAEMSNYHGVRYKAKIRPVETSKPETIKTEKVLDFAFYQAFISKFPLKEAGKTYLRGRGLSLKVVETAQVCQIENEKASISELIEEFGFSRVFEAGVLSNKSRPEYWRGLFPNNGLVFPFFEAERPAYLQYRTMEINPKYSSWRNLNGHTPRIYNSDVLDTAENNKLVICESVIDCLSAIELKMCPIGLTGVSRKLTANEIVKFKGRTVFILLDWDDAGEKRSKEMQNQFKRFGVPTIRKSRPANDVKDLNDFLVKSKQV